MLEASRVPDGEASASSVPDGDAPSIETQRKVDAAKHYIEAFFKNSEKYRQERDNRCALHPSFVFTHMSTYPHAHPLHAVRARRRD
jgi:hypothetical protein